MLTKRSPVRDALRMALFLFAIAAVFAFARGLLGCMEPQVLERTMERDVTFHGDTRFDLLERHIIDAACRQWRGFTKNRGRLAVTWDLNEVTLLDYSTSPRIRRIAPDDVILALAAAKHGRGPVCSVVVLEPEPILYLAPEKCQVLAPVVMHELGHVLDLDDIERPGAVMHQQYGHAAWFGFTGADKHECHRVGLCTE